VTLPPVFHVNDTASFAHPAGRVTGTVSKVEARAVCLHILRHGGLPPLDIWFTKRADGTYRETGKGPKSPQLERSTL